jgi:hypothetical protein
MIAVCVGTNSERENAAASAICFVAAISRRHLWVLQKLSGKDFRGVSRCQRTRWLIEILEF